MQRRRVLLTIGTAGAVGLAGCVGGRRNPDGGTPTETPTDPASSFTVTSAGCGTEANRADVAFDDGSVVVEGTTWGSQACYTARLDSATLEDGTLTVRVVTERVASEDEACADCIAEIDYRATVEASPDEVVVFHDGEMVTEARP